MIEALISSKTRIKLLLKFFLNSSNTAYLRNLEEEFQESTNSIRIELNRFEEAGLLSSSAQGNKKIFAVNKKHSMFNDLHSIVKKYFGIDKIIEEIIVKLGDVQLAFLSGNLARGLDDKTIELILIGNINTDYLNRLSKKIELEIKRKIKVTIHSTILEAKTADKNINTYLLLWSK